MHLDDGVPVVESNHGVPDVRIELDQIAILPGIDAGIIAETEAPSE